MQQWKSAKKVLVSPLSSWNSHTPTFFHFLFRKNWEPKRYSPFTYTHFQIMVYNVMVFITHPNIFFSCFQNQWKPNEKDTLSFPRHFLWIFTHIRIFFNISQQHWKYTKERAAFSFLFFFEVSHSNIFLRVVPISKKNFQKIRFSFHWFPSWIYDLCNVAMLIMFRFMGVKRVKVPAMGVTEEDVENRWI